MASNRDLLWQRLWYEGKPRWLLLLLIPCSWLFRLIAGLRRAAYRVGVFRVQRVSRPVIVIGNISVGGTGKTPFVIWMTRFLQGQGRRVGVVLRGYGGDSAHWPRDVYADTPASEVGDEPVLHAASTNAIVVAGPDRVAAAHRAIERGAEIVLTDDGLQHYRLGRDGEIAVVDAQRGLGNRRLLPAGPLREPASRLRSVDLIVKTRRSGVVTPASAVEKEVIADARIGDAVALLAGGTRPLDSFRGMRVHALAAIGNPGAFFSSLRHAGLEIVEHPYPDHSVLTRAEITFDDDAPVLMTEKDAVKCRALADGRHWAVRLDTILDAGGTALIGELVDRVMRSHAGTR